MVCVMCLTSWEFFNLKKIHHVALPLVSALYVLQSFFSFFFARLCKDVRRPKGRDFHTLAPPPHAFTNSCHV